MRRLSIRLSLLAIAGFLFSATLALGQGTSASLTGQVTDPSGAAVTNARVTVKNVGTALTQSSSSGADGVYRIAPLPPGEYTLMVEQQGFERYAQKGIVLTANLDATQNVSLKTGTVAETVEVTANAELINTTTAEIGTSVNQLAVTELPLNGRDPSSLVLLAPGITSVTAVGGTGGGMGGQPGVQSGFSFPNETGASAGGGRQGSTYYILDGVPHMDNYMGLAAPFPNADATQEFRVITNNFNALYGFAPGAVVSIETKSGTNSWHGGAFEFLRNKSLNAASYCFFTGCTPTVDPLRRNQFGGYVGGPVKKDKLFFFFNYQGTRSSQAAASNVTHTPTAAMLNGDFTGISATLCAPGAHTPAGCPFVNNKVNPTLFNPTAVAIATTALPLGQQPDGTVSYPGGALINNFDEYTARVDFNVSDKQRLSLRSFTDKLVAPSGDVPGNILSVLNLNPWSQALGEKMWYFGEALNHTWTVNATTVNSLSVFWTQMSAHNVAAVKDKSGQNVCWSRYIPAIQELPGQCFMEGFSVGGGGFNGGWTEPSQEVRTTYGIYDNVSKIVGKHSFSLGANLQHQFAEELTQYPTTAIVGFGGQYTGNGLADFLMGYMSSYTQGAGEIANVAGWQPAIYGQDQYRVRPNLTLTMGLRWEPNLAPPVKGGRGAAFVPGQQSTLFPNAPLGLVFPGDKGISKGLMPNSYNYWEPRLGIAWQPSFLAHTSIRAGFGLFTAPLMYSMYNHTADISPFSPTYGLFGGSNTPLDLSNPWSQNAATNFQSPFPPFAPFTPPSSAAFAPPFTIPAVFDQNFRLGITQSWNVSIERALGQKTAVHVAYVGSESYHQVTIMDRNPGICGPVVSSACSIDARTTYSNFIQILQNISNGTASYNALQAGVDRHLSHDLQFQSNFTWSKTLDTASSGNISFGNNALPNPFNVRYNRGISSLNVPLIWVSNLVYTSPKLSGENAFVREALGSWELSGIITLQSGYPFGIGGGYGNNSGSFQGGDRADIVAGQSFDVRQGGKSHWIQQYINPAAFAPNAVGTFGDSGKNMFQGPPVKTMDLAFAKNWSILENWKLQFRWEMFNALNHPSFANPDSNVGDGSSFGRIFGVGPIPPRVMQAALKLTF